MKENLVSKEELEKIEELLEETDTIGREELEKGVIESTSNFEDITGELIVISTSVLADSYSKTKFQIWRASGGFGCKRGAGGRAVFAQCIEDGEEARWRINDVIGVI